MADPLSFNTMVHMITIKLSAINFLLWKSQLIPLLQCQGCIGFIDGSLQQPNETITTTNGTSTVNPEFLEWKLKDQRILSLLLSSLTEEAMAAAVGLATSRDVWVALERVFSHRSKTREILLKDELQLMKKGNRSIVDFARAFKGLCDQLVAIGRPVDEVDKSHWFLHAFGTEFAAFSSTQMALTPLPSFHDLVPLAESFDLFQKSLETHTLFSAAFTATMNRGHFHGGHFRSTGNRRHRGGSHGNTNGPSSSNFGGHSGNNRSHRSYNLRCQICKTEGHTADRCQNRYDRADPSAHIAETFPSCTSD